MVAKLSTIMRKIRNGEKLGFSERARAVNKGLLPSKAKKKKNVKCIFTGNSTLTGGRLLRLKKLFKKNETFMLTYGDGVSDVDLRETLAFHKKHGKLMTMTSAQPKGRFGAIRINEDNQVLAFNEKPKGDGSWINAGYFVCQPEVLDYIDDGDEIVFEQKPLKNLNSG